MEGNGTCFTVHRCICILYTGVYVVKNVSTAIYPNTITAVMGPSGCGKSTLLRAVNRMHDLYTNIKTTGQIIL
ncbi:MAG: Phosphate import ATP-binding protein PstB [Bacteroidetes bacterium ADurb.Bin139]|nr:MAG: Phosphate import ATP-binding protein PstB [Bacteroidetes bacterium ADurb.Bin139]